MSSDLPARSWLCFLGAVNRLETGAECDSIYMPRADPVKLDILFPACPPQFVSACWLIIQLQGDGFSTAFEILSSSHVSDLCKVQDISTKAVTDLELHNKNL